VTTQNSVAAMIIGLIAVVVVTFAIALTILILDATIDHPPLRLAAMALVFFLGMYASRVFKVGPAGFLVAIIVLVSQAYVDLFPGPEPIVRAVLWVWVAVVYPAGVAVGVNLVLLPADPEPVLRREVVARLRSVARGLAPQRDSDEAQDVAKELTAFSAQGTTPLTRLMRLAELRDSSLAPMRVERMAKIHLLMRLVDSAALLADTPVRRSSEEQARLLDLAAECERYAESVATGGKPLPLRVGRTELRARSALTPVIDEIERLVRELPAAEALVVNEPRATGGWWAADALSNRDYAHFAVKVTLAAMLCYVVYTAVDWDGIHTCMITCAVVALGSAGATVHKSALRLVGCVIGGGLALASIVFLVPHMTSIGSLALLVAAVTAPSAWIAMGSERTAYLGMQIAFTFYLATLQGYGPSADLTEFRDRFVGIVFGVVVMAIVFSLVWPERAGARARQSLADALRRMAQAASDPANARLQIDAAWRSLNEAERLGRLSAFEPEALSAGSMDKSDQLKRLVRLAERVLLVQGVLAERGTAVRAEAISAETNAARAMHDRAVAGVLNEVAVQVDKNSFLPLAEPDAPLEAAGVGSTLDRDIFGDGAVREELADRVKALRRGGS
jgi:multidrug resistance protein MdtO